MATVTPLKRKKGEAYLIRFVHPRTKRFIRRVVYCSSKEAEQIRKKIDADIALGKFNIESVDISPGHSWSKLQKRYLRYARNNKSENTVKREKVVFKAFTQFLGGGDTPLSEISQATFEKFKKARIEQGVKPASVSLELRHLRTVFYQAMQWGMTDHNPVVGIKHPKRDIVTVRYLTIDEIQRLLGAINEASDHEFIRLVLAYLHTGARRIELLKPSLAWDDVDFDKRQILIRGKGKKKRFLPMNDTLLGIFQELKREGHEYPFTYKPDYVSHKIAKHYKSANIQGANLHSLRKSFGSLLLQNGKADLYTVSRLLGHASVRTTEQYYVDLLDENYRTSVAGLDQLISAT